MLAYDKVIFAYMSCAHTHRPAHEPWARTVTEVGQFLNAYAHSIDTVFNASPRTDAHVRALAQRYAAQNFTAQALYTSDDLTTLQGRAAIADFVAGASLDVVRFSRHVISNPVLTRIDARRVHVQANLEQYLAADFYGAGNTFLTLGAYQLNLVRSAHGAWRIETLLFRTVRALLFFAPPPPPAPAAPAAHAE